jgi:hypothetical protein
VRAWNPRNSSLTQHRGYLRRDLIDKPGGTAKTIVQQYSKMWQQVWQAVLNPDLLGQPIERSNSSIQDLIPVRWRNPAAPVALYNVSDLDKRVGELKVVLHLHHPSMVTLVWHSNI